MKDYLVNLEHYTKVEIDTDLSKYLVKRSDVYCYKYHDSALNSIFDHFKSSLEQGPYIIGNYLYFTLKGAKYWTTLSCWADEWNKIEQLIQELKASKIVKNIAYEVGRLD